jgi:LAO/AO transport system kinase
MVDLFLLLLAPGGGDELQGVKRGIVELADLVAVNKADGALLEAARHTASDYAHALHLVGQPQVQVLLTSALEGTGIADVWTAVEAHARAARESGALAARRAEQARDWMWSEVTETLVERVRADARTSRDVDALEADVVAGRISPAAAAHRLLERLPD